MHLRTAVLACALAACGGPRATMAPTDTFHDDGQLLVELAQSPTGGARFDFCPVPEPGEPHLTNAAWLAFVSANEYAHLFYVSSMLGELGFANADTGPDWPACAKDLRVLRGFEDRYRDAIVAASHARSLRTFLEPHAERWGACARAWFAAHYDGAQFPAAAFEKYLVHTAHPGAHVEFFSGGRYEHDGRVFAAGSTQVVVARHRTLPLVIVAFRGTEPTKWADLATDLKAWKTPLAKHGWPDGWGEVHAGFRTAYESVGEVLRAKLAEYEGQGLAIWVTGHSLGGGLATLLGAEILRRIEGGARLELRGVYTFGSPRVGDRTFRERLAGAAKRHDAQLVRFRNGDDLVTAIPRLQEYVHAGLLAHLREDKLELHDGDADYAGMGSVADHDIAGWGPKKRAVSGYYRRLHALLATRPSRCAASQ